MVNEKQTKITAELIAKRRVICIRPTMPQEKTEKKPKKYEVFKEKEAARVREYGLKKRCQSNYRSALQPQLQEQHQPRLQHFQQNKF